MKTDVRLDLAHRLPGLLAPVLPLKTSKICLKNNLIKCELQRKFFIKT